MAGIPFPSPSCSLEHFVSAPDCPLSSPFLAPVMQATAQTKGLIHLTTYYWYVAGFF